MFSLPSQTLYLKAVDHVTNTPINLSILPSVSLVSDNVTIDTPATIINAATGKFSIQVNNIPPGTYEIVAKMGTVVFTPNFHIIPKGNTLANAGLGVPAKSKGNFLVCKAVPTAKEVNLDNFSLKDYNGQNIDMSSYNSRVIFNNKVTTLPPSNNFMTGLLEIEYYKVGSATVRTNQFYIRKPTYIIVDNIQVAAQVDNTPIIASVTGSSDVTTHEVLHLTTQVSDELETVSF